MTSPSVSLVLGSGGARGYAHIGAIEELLAQGFDIRSVAGSSMGALIGGVYAAGKLDAYRDWARPLQRFDVLARAGVLTEREAALRRKLWGA